MANKWGKNRNGGRFFFSWVKQSLWKVTAAMKLRWLLLWRKAMTNLDSIFKSRDISLKATKVHLYSQSYGFSSSHVQMWEMDHKEGWALKNWCFSSVVLENTLKNPLDSKEIKPVNPKGNQPWIFIGMTDAEAEAPIFWPPDAKNQLTGKALMLGKTEGRRRTGQERMKCLDGITDNEHKFEQTPGDGKAQGSPVCCSPWCHKESNTT